MAKRGRYNSSRRELREAIEAMLVNDLLVVTEVTGSQLRALLGAWKLSESFAIVSKAKHAPKVYLIRTDA